MHVPSTGRTALQTQPMAVMNNCGSCVVLSDCSVERQKSGFFFRENILLFKMFPIYWKALIMFLKPNKISGYNVSFWHNIAEMTTKEAERKCLPWLCYGTHIGEVLRRCLCAQKQVSHANVSAVVWLSVRDWRLDYEKLSIIHSFSKYLSASFPGAGNMVLKIKWPFSLQFIPQWDYSQGNKYEACIKTRPNVVSGINYLIV